MRLFHPSYDHSPLMTESPKAPADTAAGEEKEEMPGRRGRGRVGGKQNHMPKQGLK